MRTLALTLMLVLGLSACGDDNGGEGPDVAAWLGLAEGNSWDYQVENNPDGVVTVVKIDSEFKDGVNAYKLEFRVGGFVQVTRWYQIDPEGLFLLGMEAQEGGTVISRTFLTRINTIPYPLELAGGQLKQSWNTTSDLDEGGSEVHRFDNQGIETIEVPAGTLQAYHLVHTRTDSQAVQHQYNLYFTPENWLAQFDYPEGTAWKLR